MSTAEVGSLALALALMLIIGTANLMGHLFLRMRQPKIVGEILAGILIGPMIITRLVPSVATLFGAKGSVAAGVLSFLYNLGMLLLMFLSGSAARRVLAKENRGPTAWLLAFGTTLPFLFGLGLSNLLPLDTLTGPRGVQSSVALVFAIAVSVTSIPVISHIFNSLGIINTRFASVVLGVAVLEDVALWAVLALATALSAATVNGALGSTVSLHVGTTVAYLGAGLIVMPSVLRWLSRARWNVVAQHSPIGWVMTILLAYVGIAGALDVTLAFAGFLAGYGIVGGMKAKAGSTTRAATRPRQRPGPSRLWSLGQPRLSEVATRTAPGWSQGTPDSTRGPGDGFLAAGYAVLRETASATCSTNAR